MPNGIIYCRILSSYKITVLYPCVSSVVDITESVNLKMEYFSDINASMYYSQLTDYSSRHMTVSVKVSGTAVFIITSEWIDLGNRLFIHAP
jgi:hypothetical protein